MLKMALPDYAINEKCCSVDGGRGRPSIFVPTLKDLTAQRSPPPGIYQGKKMLMHTCMGVSTRAGVSWAQLELTGALLAFSQSAKFTVLVLLPK